MKLHVMKLESERKRLGFPSMAKFSRFLGMSDCAYSKMIRNGTTTFNRLAEISNKLHVDPRDLLLK